MGWEYAFPIRSPGESPHSILNRMDADGWELVTIEPEPLGCGETYVMRRHKGSDPEERLRAAEALLVRWLHLSPKGSHDNVVIAVQTQTIGFLGANE